MQHFKGLGHDEALIALQAIKEKLLIDNAPAVIAVAGVSGELIGLLCLDGAKQASIEIAASKAWTAARERVPSGNLGIAAKDPIEGFDMAYFGDRKYIGWGGGLPVILDGETLGAVAVSGLTEELDTEYAQIGVKAIYKVLRQEKIASSSQFGKKTRTGTS